MSHALRVRDTYRVPIAECMNGEGMREDTHMEITVLVKVSIPVTVAYDSNVAPSNAKLRRDVLANFLDHPVFNGQSGALGSYLDSFKVIDTRKD